MSTLPRTKPLTTPILTTLLPSSGHLTKHCLHLDLRISPGAGVRQPHLHHAVKVSDTLEVNYEKNKKTGTQLKSLGGTLNKGEVVKYFLRTYPFKKSPMVTAMPQE